MILAMFERASHHRKIKQNFYLLIILVNKISRN